MRRIKLVVSYDGTAYCGWQLQPNGVTIEEVLNKALSSLLKEDIQVIGASRTDSGVHAMGNVAVFDTESRIPGDKICFALNQRLPDDVRIQASEEVPLTFHPRKENCVKTYEYKILNRKIDMPLQRLYSHFCYFNLDLEKMQKAASYLIGEHDFKSFCTVRTQAEETVRTIYSLTVTKADDLITIRISGSGFLYNMVRIIAGTLVKIGMGVYPPEKMEEILEEKNRAAAGPTIPALHHIILSDGSCHIRCQEQHRWHLIIESCHDDGMFHGSAGHQVLVYFFHIFLGLADGHVDTEDILALLVHDGIQCDLGLAGLFVSDDQLSLSFTDGA